MKKRIVWMVAVVALVGALFGSVLSVQASPGNVTLKQYDPAAYQSMVEWYESAGWTQSDAVAAASRIVVEGVYPSDLVTPTPTATPAPVATLGPTGTCTQDEWEQIINSAIALHTSPASKLLEQCGVSG
jgi:hypothetical protein